LDIMAGPIRHRRVRSVATGLLALLVAAVAFRSASALILGGEGNKPVADPGWPKGAAAVFNHPARVAWWEGPPFGGGEWHAECRGDAKALTAVLADFARLDVRSKRVILHDGVGASFWLNPNGEPAKQAAARIDWAFMVWVPVNWERHRRMPAELRPINQRDAVKGPPAQLDIYTGGTLRWSDVVVPKGLEIVDERLEGHGFSPGDGIVLEGKVADLATGRPIAARMRLERIEPQANGGYRYDAAARADSDARGRWVLKKAPAGWHRLVVEAEGHVPRVAGYVRFDDQPRWASYDCGLSRPAPVEGRVIDDSGQPLADVEVQIRNAEPGASGRYESPEEPSCRTDADGRFHSDRLPVGAATVWVRKRGYVRPGLGLSIQAPARGIELSMMRSAGVRILVEFDGPRPPGGYIVEIEPESGSVVGSWGGSGEIDAANRIAFHEAPPGRYVLKGRPNPSSGNQHQAGPVTIELKGGQTLPVTLHARSK
jgi:protocatechuate 3,4-dioxygenase beta subunit